MPGGWHHAMSRGINRHLIYKDTRDRNHFLELLQMAVERYRVRIHAYVLMDNHFHLLLETPEGNLAECMQWVKQAYAMWYNVRHDRVGPLFQGRYRSLPVEDAGWIFELSQYVHLNPLRLARFKLSKLDRQAERQDDQKPLSREEATRRLRELRSFPWSSYRAYAGYAMPPSWLTVDCILERAGGRDQRTAYRNLVTTRLTGGEPGTTLETVQNAMAVGSARFCELVKARLGTAGREIAGHRAARGKADLEKVIKAVERTLGEPVLKEKRGGIGRDMVLKIARDVCGLTLKELGEKMGGLDYVTVHLAIRRLERRLDENPPLRNRLDKIKQAILK